MSKTQMSTTAPADAVGALTPTPQTAPTPPTAAKPADTEAKAAKPSTPDDQQPAAAPSERLMIQESGETGVFVYTILDRASGMVLAQIPREEVVRLASRPDYTAGQVIDTKA